MKLFSKITHPHSTYPALDILLRKVPPSSDSLRTRLAWIRRLVKWVRRKEPTHVHTTRLKYILQVLDRDTELKERVSETLRSVIQDTRALELFMNVGIPNQLGFIQEFFERLSLFFLPQIQHDSDLISVFSETFRFESDADWIQFMTPDVFDGWVALFSYSNAPIRSDWNTLTQDARDAVFLLSHMIRTIGLSRLVRNRVAEGDFKKLPFFELPQLAEAFLESKGHDRFQASHALFENLKKCLKTLAEVQSHFRNQGASVDLIYQVEQLKAHLHRLETLVKLLIDQAHNPRLIQEFFGLLVRENTRTRKMSSLFTDNLTLISQKIVETNAETGEHYITRDRHEYWEILKKSWGGGLITGVTTLFKILLSHLTAPPFIMGAFSFCNYGISFLGIQALGFTLATKQPAMTAATIASKIGEPGESVTDLIDEIVHLVRSQFTAVLGNIWGVVPMVILIDLAFSTFGSHLTDTEHAQHTLQSFSILGPTPFYAAATGVLLWVSSVYSGWFSNWFSFREMPEFIEHHPWLRATIGKPQAKRIAEFSKMNAGGLASNLSLAFLLAMTPHFATFFGIPFDARHVTLSSGALAASSMAIGGKVFSDWNFWHAVFGILSMAVLNLGVAFSLALLVAIWAKKVAAPRRSVIYRALLKVFLKKPWVFLFPPATVERA